MHETPDEIEALQHLLDRSYQAAGEHLRRIHSNERRMTARELVNRLQGMRLLVLATVSPTGRPLTGAVDGLFHRGSFYFGTAPDAVRWRHIRSNQAVSATHLPSEEWGVTVHGRAVPADISPSGPTGLRATLLEVYTPRYGAEWETFLDSGVAYARIEAERLYAIDVGQV